MAPTNNQDNHKGNWGDSNTARSVVLAEDLSEESIYDAMKNYRVYATEDNDLSILYTLNDNAMGSILDDQDDIDIEVYNQKFINSRYTGKFRTKDGIEQVLKVLQIEHKFTYTKNNDLNLITIK